jgi:hypothetical protein
MIIDCAHYQDGRTDIWAKVRERFASVQGRALPAAYPGGPWLLRILVPSGLRAVVVPSGCRVTVHPH